MQLWLERTRDLCVACDRRWVQACHRIASRPLPVLLMVVASRLGDGPLWVVLIALLLLAGGPTGAACALQMLATGAFNAGAYRVIKLRTSRPRPFVACPGIRACTPALDNFSFPSGHTLHAVAFAVVLSYHYPWAVWIAGPFALLVAASRMVLGLHYPSDVAAGAAIGVASAAVVLMAN